MSNGVMLIFEKAVDYNCDLCTVTVTNIEQGIDRMTESLQIVIYIDKL